MSHEIDDLIARTKEIYAKLNYDHDYSGELSDEEIEAALSLVTVDRVDNLVLWNASGSTGFLNIKFPWRFVVFDYDSEKTAVNLVNLIRLLIIRLSDIKVQNSDLFFDMDSISLVTAFCSAAAGEVSKVRSSFVAKDDLEVFDEAFQEVMAREVCIDAAHKARAAAATWVSLIEKRSQEMYSSYEYINDLLDTSSDRTKAMEQKESGIVKGISGLLRGYKTDDAGRERDRLQVSKEFTEAQWEHFSALAESLPTEVIFPIVKAGSYDLVSRPFAREWFLEHYKKILLSPIVG